MSRVPVVVNPTAGGGRLLRHRRACEAAAGAAGVELEWWPTTAPGHGEALGRMAAAAGHPLVLALGGDGTYNEVARGIVGSSTALGVLPGGSSSVLAYELGVPRPPPRAVAALLAGADRAMRVGRTSRDELILLMLSAGPDSVVVRELSEDLKRRDGRVAVAVQVVRELVRRRPLPRIRITAAGQTIDGGWVVVSNGRCYGGPFHAAPGADPFADRFEVVVQRRVGRPAAAGFAIDLALGRHLGRRDVVRVQTARVTIEPEPASAEVPYQIDGDAVGRLPVVAWIADESLTVRLPPGSTWSRE